MNVNQSKFAFYKSSVVVYLTQKLSGKIIWVTREVINRWVSLILSHSYL